MNSKSRSDYRSDSVPHAPSQASFKSRLMISFTHFPSNYRPINSHRGFSHCSILNLNFNSREPLLLEFSRTESRHISGKLEPSSSSLLLLKRWIFFLPRYFLRMENIEICQSPFSQISQTLLLHLPISPPIQRNEIFESTRGEREVDLINSGR